MKKSSLFQKGSYVSFVLSLCLMGAVSYAQVNPKDSQPRTTTNPVTGVGGGLGDKRSLPRTSNNPVVTPGNTGTTGVPGTTATNPSGNTPGNGTPTGNTPTTNHPGGTSPTGNTGVNGTTDVPTNTDDNGPLGGKTQVGGVNKEDPNGKKTGGKRVGGPNNTSDNSTNSSNNSTDNSTNSSSTDPKNQPVTAVTDGSQASQTDKVTASDKDKTGTDGTDDQNKDKTDGTDGVTSTDPKNGTEGLTGTGPSKTPCEDEAVKKIYEILQQDTSGVLSNLYELTSRRLALRALSQGSDSLEALVRKDIKGFESKISGMKNSEAIQTQVKAVYETYGKGSDLAKINDDFDKSFKKAKIACYWTNYRHNQRVWNEEASSYVLAVSLGEKDSGLSDIDVATIWTMEKIRTAALVTDPSYAYGKANGNLLNISTRVARYLGRIGGARNAKEDEIKKELAEIQQSVDQAIEKAYAQVKTSLYACIEEHNKGCENCIVKAKSEFETNRLNFDKIQRGLLQAVAKAENVKMEKALKSKMGDVNFDLSDFATGTVPEDHRKSISKIDACGNVNLNRVSSASSSKKKSAKQPAPVVKKQAPLSIDRFPAQKPAVDNTYVKPPVLPKDVQGVPVRFQDNANKQKQFFDNARKAWEAAHPGEKFPDVKPDQSYIGPANDDQPADGSEE